MTQGEGNCAQFLKAAFALFAQHRFHISIVAHSTIKWLFLATKQELPVIIQYTFCQSLLITYLYGITEERLTVLLLRIANSR